MHIDEIMAPIENEMKEFDIHFSSQLKSKVPLIDKITNYIIKRKGKQLRPMFLFLTAKMLGEITHKTYQAASLVELLHTATLVHDDVVDDANERRGFFSINALWKNKIAVLVGDYMLSRILLLSIENKNIRVLEIVARAVREMSEGELLQIEKARTLDITEEIYFEVIRKTGEDIGKPTGLDIRERKMTLPLIYALKNADKKTKRDLIYIIKNKNEERKEVEKAVLIVKNSGGLAYASDKMHELKNKALLLLKDIPNSEAKTALIGLVNYTIERTK